MEQANPASERQFFRIEEAAPNFAATAYYNGQEIKVNLTDYCGKWLMLFFYPGDFTFVCPTELAAVADAYPYITQQGADVLAISTDSVYSHKIFHDISPSAKKIQYPLLSDRNGHIAKLYGVYWPREGICYRASFIIDPQGKIRYFSLYPNEVGRNVWEMLRVLQALQFGAQSGQGVPAGWEPGMPGVSFDFNQAGKI